MLIQRYCLCEHPRALKSNWPGKYHGEYSHIDSNIPVTQSAGRFYGRGGGHVSRQQPSGMAKTWIMTRVTHSLPAGGTRGICAANKVCAVTLIIGCFCRRGLEDKWPNRDATRG
ncbi:hypothetical protein SUGI_0084000 [Cryptomeria japonica]|nr:hypothetical protein SUGI_0084000 [Cryptomeria japonica]